MCGTRRLWRIGDLQHAGFITVAAVDEARAGTVASARRRLTTIRLSGIGLMVFLTIAYAAVVVLYARSTEPVNPVLGIPDEEAADKLVVAMDYSGLSAQESAATLEMKIVPTPELLDDDGFLKDKLDVLVFQVDAEVERTARALPVEGTTVTFESGALILTQEVRLRPSGRRESYPFDRYEGYVSVTVVATREGVRREVPSLLVIGGDAPGWNVQSVRNVDHPAEAEGQLEWSGGSFVYYEVSRAGSTVTIVVLILGAMVLMILCAALVSRSVLRKRRRIEATMASWFAALLFAVIPLRLNMPGAPPMGVWMDFLVVLWVEVGLMIALAVFIYSWLAYTPTPD